MMTGNNEILVPTDFSTGSRLAVDYALELAARLGARVHLVHVVDDPNIAGLFTEAYIDMALIDAVTEREEVGPALLMAS